MITISLTTDSFGEMSVDAEDRASILAEMAANGGNPVTWPVLVTTPKGKMISIRMELSFTDTGDLNDLIFDDRFDDLLEK
jgi:hypothetical protein